MGSRSSTIRFPCGEAGPPARAGSDGGVFSRRSPYRRFSPAFVELAASGSRQASELVSTMTSKRSRRSTASNHLAEIGYDARDCFTRHLGKGDELAGSHLLVGNVPAHDLSPASRPRLRSSRSTRPQRRLVSQRQLGSTCVCPKVYRGSIGYRRWFYHAQYAYLFVVRRRMGEPI
jgi:hypothetical protein